MVASAARFWGKAFHSARGKESHKGSKHSAIYIHREQHEIAGMCRCQIDKTEKWHMVCGKCWNEVSL